ncbi:hypothetical protein SFRURICE_001089 [Spodoptera frugiperda]|nr:hypothetical protein SFRURICE_001089 [Spodoptera frugiperda]
MRAMNECYGCALWLILSIHRILELRIFLTHEDYGIGCFSTRHVLYYTVVNAFGLHDSYSLLPPIILFIGTHSLALVETDSAKLCSYVL